MAVAHFRLRSLRHGGQVASPILRLTAGIQKNSPEPWSGPSELLHRLKSIRAIADVDRAVGSPFPAAVVSVEAVAEMTMSEMTVAEMTTPKMAVAVTTVMAVTTVAMTAGESLTRDGERGSSQRQSRNSGGNRALDPGHECLLVGQREDRSAMIQPRRAERGGM
jgi:hypothetical protein